MKMSLCGRWEMCSEQLPETLMTVRSTPRLVKWNFREISNNEAILLIRQKIGLHPPFSFSKFADFEVYEIHPTRLEFSTSQAPGMYECFATKQSEGITISYKEEEKQGIMDFLFRAE
jgi:hypothetical protein